MESSGGFEVHCCSFFVEIRTPVRRVLPVAGASSGGGRIEGRKERKADYSLYPFAVPRFPLPLLLRSF